VYLPDGKAAAVGDASGKVWIVDLEKKAVRKTFEGHRGAVTCLAVSADGKSLASGSADTTVLIWDLTKP
jgi:glucose repression regulatory protein TUP1